ncbi:MAG: N-6 DNA methylase [Candidatus Sericytochromatia bacterium]|nr:N-6 DNA methylase [Candidatus Tanganyikabacteria bacterium]
MATQIQRHAAKDLLLDEAVDQLAGRLPVAVAPEGRRREAASYLVAASLEGLLLGEPDEALAEAVRDAARSGMPLLTDDVTRKQEERLAAELSPVVASLFGRASWTPGDGELLGPLFERSLAADHRKSLGQYYTPDAIIAFLLERALEPFDPLAAAPFRVIDPACGAGNFLAPAAERLLAAYRERRADLVRARPGERWDDASLVARIFRDHLAGLDIDPWAVRVCRIRLRLKALALAARTLPDPLVGHGDALRQGSDAHVVLAERYAAVVGNPPYGADLSATEKAYVAARYHLGKGRYDTTALFVERGLQLLQPGGRLALVAPHGITRTGAYGPCRELLARTARYVALLDAGQAFPGVNLEAVAFVAQRRTTGDPPDGPVDLATMRGGRLERLGRQAESFFRDRPTVPIYVPGDVGTLVARLEAGGRALSELARIRRGCPISARDPGIGRHPGVPVVRGRDIARYAILTPADLLALAREARPLFGPSEPAALGVDRVGFQNIASGVVATLLPAGTLPLDTVNVLEPREDLDLLGLLGFLNSRLAAFYFRLVISNMANLTVHLDAPTLGSLPVPDLLPSVGAAVRALLELRGTDAPLQRLDAAATVVDDAVFAAAGLGPPDRAIVLQRTEPQLAALARRRRG